LEDKLAMAGIAILPTGLTLYLPTRIAIDRKEKLLIVDRLLGLMRRRFPFKAITVYETDPPRTVSRYGRSPSRAFIVAVNRPTRTEVYAGMRMRDGLAARLKIELKRILGKDVPVLHES
jgi:hypothetical protein